ncbi:Fpg/Nei family DNA glycosylase [Humidisolicoccus flavus]|uniref:Fpg/Nei family DNA glycosylase n=1 Tax=Humidisolicoccus flavus TaxID=3111414 RepID=UPI00324490A7
MPEGHSIHRIARQFTANFVGRRVAVSSPQGRFAQGAAVIDGLVMEQASAVGKHLLLSFGDEWLHVHLGLYGAWDFSGEISADDTILSAQGRMGQTNMRGSVADGAWEESLHSIGAPRRARIRIAEGETEKVLDENFPPEPVGQVRARLLTETTVADLRGPTRCDVISKEEVPAVIQRLGPDPLALFESKRSAEDRFVQRVRKSRTTIGQLLMDQSVVAGIGNVYRAELLFRAQLNPYASGTNLREEQARDLWKDWVKLLKIGVDTGQMMTMDGLRGARKEAALAHRSERHWVYKREGEPCRVCGTPIVIEEMAARKLYFCPSCQA